MRDWDTDGSYLLEKRMWIQKPGMFAAGGRVDA